jgi:hypothetical protein
MLGTSWSINIIWNFIFLIAIKAIGLGSAYTDNKIDKCDYQETMKYCIACASYLSYISLVRLSGIDIKRPMTRTKNLIGISADKV